MDFRNECLLGKELEISDDDTYLGSCLTKDGSMVASNERGRDFTKKLLFGLNNAYEFRYLWICVTNLGKNCRGLVNLFDLIYHNLQLFEIPN